MRPFCFVLVVIVRRGGRDEKRLIRAEVCVTGRHIVQGGAFRGCLGVF